MSRLTIRTEPAMVSSATAMEAIALEANFIANATQLAQQYFPSVVKQFKSLVGTIEYEKKIDKKEFSKSQFALLNIVSKAEYEKLKKVMIDVPEGFDHNLLKTFTVVGNSLDTINKDLLSYITAYKRYLANFITNKDSKKSLVDMTVVAKKTTNDTQRLVLDISKLFHVGSNAAQQSFGSLFDNPQEVEKVLREYQKLNPSFKAIEINKIKDEIEQISGLLDSVIKQINEAKFELLSPEVLKSLSEGSYAVAKSAEAIAIVYFKLIAIFNIVPNLENTITEDVLE